MILHEKYMNYIRNQARMGDDAEDDQFQCAKYWKALEMLVDAWRMAWPDCRLKVSGFKKEGDAYEAEVFVELPPYSYPGGKLDRFRETFRFTDSDDLVIDFCRVARTVTDRFYDWQQDTLRRSLQRS